MKKLHFFISFIALCTLPSPAWAHPDHRITQNTFFDGGVHEGNFIIDADNIWLFCDGLTIIGTGVGNGILLEGRQGVTVEQCNITNFREGVVMRGGSHTNVFRSNRVHNNVDDGFQMEEGSRNNFFVQNTVTQNGEDGFDLEGSGVNFFTENNVNRNKQNGIELSRTDTTLVPSNGNIFIRNNINNNGMNGVSLEHADDNFFISNTANSNANHGFAIENQSNNNTFINNRACANRSFDLFEGDSTDDNVFSLSNTFCRRFPLGN